MGLALLPAEPLVEDRQGRMFAAALQQTKAILVEPQTMGIIALGAVTAVASLYVSAGPPRCLICGWCRS